LLEFPARAEAAQKTAFIASAFDLIGANHVDAGKIKNWIPDWKSAFTVASEKAGVDIRVSLTRINYYEKAIKAMLEGEIPIASLWPLLHTWTMAVEVLEGDHLKFWQNAAGELGLLGMGFGEHVEALDHFIDEVEIVLDEIANQNGLDTSTGM
jgi:hypothetical protein